MTSEQFNSSYLSLAPTLYKVAFYILETQDDAEDAVQELYLKLWKNRDALDAVRNPRAYAVTLLRNICLDRIRQAYRIVDAEPQEGSCGVFDPDRAMDERERLQRVLAAVKSLPDEQRDILILRTVEGLDYNEIAALTGTGYLTLRVLLAKARKKLKETI